MSGLIKQPFRLFRALLGKPADRYAGIHFQDAPNLKEYPCFDVDIVSPQLPCGAAWLASCCLELGIPVWKPWGLDIQDYWQRLEAFQYRYIKPPTSFQGTLPGLQTGRAFTFLPEPVPRFSHRWPLTVPDQNRTILFVRDPRDALYSDWQRKLRNQQIATDLSYQAFLTSPYHHYPFTQRDYLLLFLRMWQSVLSDREHLIIRFEDFKTEPGETLKRALDFMGVNATEAQLETALSASDYKVVKRIEDDFEGTPDNPQSLSNRAGIPFEYLQSYTVAMHEGVGERFDALYQWLGYEGYSEAREKAKPVERSAEQLSAIVQAMDSVSLAKRRKHQLQSLYAQLSRDIT